MPSVLLLLAQLCVLHGSHGDGDEGEAEDIRLRLDDFGGGVGGGVQTGGKQPSCLEATFVKALFWSGEEEQLCQCWASLVCMQYSRCVGVVMEVCLYTSIMLEYCVTIFNSQ